MPHSKVTAAPEAPNTMLSRL
ncbi:hypothetical protein CP8484711_0101A, partial [Chlamydia psittaci 84-8471/1]